MRRLEAGGAAHGRSPVGGVGVKLGVQDAVTPARIPGTPVSVGPLTTEHLAAVEERTAWPAPGAKTKISPRFVLRLLRQLPARAVGLGLRPERWDTGLDWPAA